MDGVSDPLSAAAIVLPGVDVRVVERCRSTNDLAFSAAPPVLIAAEVQTAGRGRRGRRWHSAPGAGVTFSLGRRIERPLRELAALPLVAGVAVARALRALGVDNISLKWPNDLLVKGAKLGGILVETRASGYAVIGVGINCRPSAELAAKVKHEVAFLEQFSDAPRNAVIQKAATALLEGIDAFEASGLDGVRAQWEAMDAHVGQRLRVRLANGRTLSGVASGLAADGALQLLTTRGMRAVHSGRVVSSRPQ